MTTPFKFQEADVEKLEAWGGRGLLAHDMGLGKSFSSLLFLHRNRAFPATVVCPASVKYAWQREAAQHFGIRATVLEGTRPRPWAGGKRPRLAVVNYDILGPWLDQLKGNKLVILDESQMVGNLTARRTQNCQELCRGVPHVLALSGTPLTNRPAELWPTLNILAPDRFPAFQPFGMAYCAPKYEYGKWNFKGADNLPALHRLLSKTVMLRRRKEDVLKQLPSFRRVILPVKLDGLQEYEAARDDFVGWLATTDPKKLRRALRAEGLAQIAVLKRLIAEAKLPAVLEWIDGFLASDPGKLVVFATHRRIVRAIHERYAPNSVYIDGSVTGRDRQAAVDAFRSRRGLRVCVGNMKAMGVGLNGLQVACTELFAELGWNPGTHSQAEARCWRIGSKLPVTAYYLVAHGTFEEQLLALIQRKQGVISEALDGRSPQGVDFDLFDQLCRLLHHEDRRTSRCSPNSF